MKSGGLDTPLKPEDRIEVLPIVEAGGQFVFTEFNMGICPVCFGF